MGDLRFDFRKADAQIRELEEIAADIERLAVYKYEQTIQDVGSAWGGAGAEAYMKKAVRLQDKIESCAKDIKNSAEVYRSVVKRVRTAECLAIQIVSD